MNIRPRLSKLSVLLGLMLGSGLMLLAGGSWSARLREAGQMALAPLGDGGMYIETALKSGAKRGGNAREQSLAAENERLLTQLADAQRRLIERDDLWQRQVEEIQHIRHSAFGPLADMPFELIPARVIGRDSLPYWQSAILAAREAKPGSAVTVRMLQTDLSKRLPDQLAVIMDSVLVGRIVKAGAFTAEMQLLTDRSFDIHGQIERVVEANNPRQIRNLSSGTAALEMLSVRNNVPIPVVAWGDGVGGLTVQNLPDYHNVRVGDWLMTRRDDPYLRSEIQVGRVSEVKPNPTEQGFVNVRISPMADLATVRDVYIVLLPPETLPLGVSK